MYIAENFRRGSRLADRILSKYSLLELLAALVVEWIVEERLEIQPCYLTNATVLNGRFIAVINCLVDCVIYI